MRDENHAHAEFGLQPQEEAEHLPLHRSIERGNGTDAAFRITFARFSSAHLTLQPAQLRRFFAAGPGPPAIVNLDLADEGMCLRVG